MTQRGKSTWCSQHVCSHGHTEPFLSHQNKDATEYNWGEKSKLPPRAQMFYSAFPWEFRKSVVLLHWQIFYSKTNNPKVIMKLLLTRGLIWIPTWNFKFLYLASSPSLWLFQVYSFQNHTEVPLEAAHGFGRPPLLSFTSKARKNHNLWKGLVRHRHSVPFFCLFFTITVITKMNNHNHGFLLHNLLPSLQTFKKPQVLLYMQ